MLRRSILGISSHRSVRWLPTRMTTQIPLYLSSRKEFSSASEPNLPKGSDSAGKSSDSRGSSSKVVIGSIALGAAALAAYQTGYLDKFFTKEQNSNLNTHMIQNAHEEPQKLNDVNRDLHDGEQAAFQIAEGPEISSGPTIEHVEKNNDTDPYYNRRDEDSKVSDLLSKPEHSASDEAGKLPSSPHSSLTSGNENNESTTAIPKGLGTENQEAKPATERNEAVQSTPKPSQGVSVIGENAINSEQPPHLGATNVPEGVLSNNVKEPDSLIDAYLLRDKAEGTSSFLDKDIVEAVQGTNDVYVSKDGKLVLDFLQAIHAAEKRQAELDAQIFSEEKRHMKEKYEKELKDARARELMYAERETMLDKELHKEKLKAAAALKSLQEKYEEELRIEIERKEAEAELELKKLQDLAKAELTAAIASEKASQIEKMAEANLNISALCMAFYARSEEARQSHSVHKLALGALALEEALSKGLPIQKEIDALNTYIDGIDKDSLLGVVMASLPEETLKNGTDTILQLNQKFDGLKGTLRHLSLMPPGGGGMLAHSLAYIASMLKVKEADQSGDGVESVINRVETFLAEGRLLEAVETLESGLKGSQAAEVVGDWVRQARNRAITEQALTLLQSYATSVSLT